MRILNSKFRIYSIRSKLIVVFCSLIAITTFINAILLYSNTSILIENKSTIYTMKVNEQINTAIDAYFKTIERLSMQISYNDFIQGIIKNRYETGNADYFYGKDQNSIFNYLEGERNIVSSINGIYIYRNDGFVYYSYPSTLLNYDFKAETQLWKKSLDKAVGFKTIVGPNKDTHSSFRTDMVISYVSKIFDFKKLSDIKVLDMVGILAIQIDIDEFVDEILANYQNNILSNIYIVNSENRIIYSSSERNLTNTNLDAEIIKQVSNYKQHTVKTNYNGSKCLISMSASNYTGWKVINITPQKELIKGIDVIRDKSIIMSLFLSLIASILSVLMARDIVNPIKKLKEMLGKIERGEFGLVIQSNINNELSLLISGYNKMSVKLKGLIDQIYLEEAKKRKAEIVALQSQINPHFIYNTLSTIKQMAVIQKADSIMEMSNSLITLLQSAAQYKDGFIEISKEIELIKSYIYIQETRYYGKFIVNFNYRDEVLKYKTLNLVLQPIVENAIFHGIVPKNGIGTINISIDEIDQSIIYTVTDDGNGIHQDSLDYMLNNPDESSFDKLGIVNVDRRIKLYFGKEYGLFFKSELNIGTEVIIRIPKII